MSNNTTRAHKEVEGSSNEGRQRRDFMRAVLRDLRALERMLEEKRFEKGVHRVGAEQEMFLVDRAYQPAPGALKMLEQLKDPHFTTELGLFQLELNAAPQSLSTDGFARMERQLTELMDKTRLAAEAIDLKAVLVGILPTIRKSDLGMSNMVPSPRYLTLSKAVHAMRGGDFEISIKGLDELVVGHDSVMAEACNSSFQVHLQVDADDFARQYNLAQVLAAPLLAMSTNSPLLFGKRLWAETRIALFQQSVDTRSKTEHQRDAAARVTFGSRFIEKSIVEIFKEDIARFRTLVGVDKDEDPEAVLNDGRLPELKALRLHNGTIYRWNRACYGIVDGKAHLRIENRVMPSGPSVLDEVANAAFWCGAMLELSQKYDDVAKHIDFDLARGNFLTAARVGLSAQLHWLDGREVSATSLVLDELLPAAEVGLRRCKVDESDIKRYLGIVEARVRTGRTGSKWLLSSLQGMKDKGTPAERQNALVAAIAQRQGTGRPVAEWESARFDEASTSHHSYQRVEQYMTTTLFTVQPDDPVELVSNLMSWERIRHVPVEDMQHQLLGLVSYRAVQRFLADGGHTKDVAVSEIMKTPVTTVTTMTSTLEAIRLMRRYRIGCLPVVDDKGKLVGIVTEENFMTIAGELLEQRIDEEKQAKPSAPRPEKK